MKVVILDGYTENPGDLTWEKFKAFGQVTVYDRTCLTNEQEIIKRIGDAEIAVTNKTPISARTMDACPSLRFITILATGYNIVDVEHAAKRGIPVSNIPTYGTAAVGQFAIALLLEICHHIGHHSNSVHSGKWASAPDFCYWDYPLVELAGKTMGIIGFGKIGQTVGRIAKALGMKVIANDHRPSESGKEIADYVTMDELLAQSDVISLHCPLFPETNGIINRHTISKMKDGVVIINNSRGSLIVEDDLAEALRSGKVAGAAVDVVSSEPIKTDNALLNAPNCIITPHISWAPIECRKRIMDGTIDNITAFLNGKPINTVNM